MGIRVEKAPTAVYAVQRKSNGWYVGKYAGDWQQYVTFDCLCPNLEDAQRKILAQCASNYELGGGFIEPPSWLTPDLFRVVTFKLMGPYGTDGRRSLEDSGEEG